MAIDKNRLMMIKDFQKFFGTLTFAIIDIGM